MENLNELLNDEASFNQISKMTFDVVDNDKNGGIDISELSKCMESIAQEANIVKPTNEEIEEIMKNYDSDKSGKLEFEEFKVLVRKILENMTKEVNAEN